jgi:hypothetical protein
MTTKPLPLRSNLRGSKHIDRFKHFYTSIRFWGAAAIRSFDGEVASNRRKAWPEAISLNNLCSQAAAMNPGLRLGSTQRVIP